MIGAGLLLTHESADYPNHVLRRACSCRRTLGAQAVVTLCHRSATKRDKMAKKYKTCMTLTGFEKIAPGSTHQFSIQRLLFCEMINNLIRNSKTSTDQPSLHSLKFTTALPNCTNSLKTQQNLRSLPKTQLRNESRIEARDTE